MTTVDRAASAVEKRPPPAIRPASSTMHPCFDGRRWRMFLRSSAMDRIDAPRSNECMTTTSDIQSAVVIGGTGKTGARVAQRLTAVGIRTRIASRTSGTRFDWNDQATWQPAVSGVDVAYVTYAQIWLFRNRAPTSRSSRSLRTAKGFVAWCSCPGAVNRRRRKPSRFSPTAVWNGLWCGPVGLPRTSVRVPTRSDSGRPPGTSGR